MAHNRPKVPSPTRAKLFEESGGKCANPGCPNVLIEMHHIREWHVHKEHDVKHMIVLCPACHDSVTRGDLRITDEDAYAWKQLHRSRTRRGHLYVEPSDDAPPAILMGSISWRGGKKLAVISDTERHSLSFSTNSMEILNLNAVVSSTTGRALARVVDGHFEAAAGTDAIVLQRPGRFAIRHKVRPDIMPVALLQQMRAMYDDYAPENIVTLLDMTVVAPNVVAVEGIWVNEHGGLIATERDINFVSPTQWAPIAVRGGGMSTVVECVGSVTGTIFSLHSRNIGGEG